MADRTVAVLFGTRPEAIKMCPLIQELDRRPGLTPRVVVTGQHAEVLDQVLALFRVTPDADLALHTPGQTLTALASRILADVPPVLERLRPDVVVVQGDTTSTVAAALAAVYLGIPVVHLEAGLRSGQRHAPFPEEINRRATSQLADLHLAATPANKRALLSEGVSAADVVVTGNTVIDALLAVTAEPRPWAEPALATLDPGRALVLVTAHRRESWGRPLVNIAEAIADVARHFPHVDVVWPLHPNPLVQRSVAPCLSELPNVVLTGPLGYADFSALLARAVVAVTDSGGIQEEAPAVGTPVLITRDVTERAEVLQAGAGRLVGTDRAVIVAELTRLLVDPAARAAMVIGASPYGDGRASARAAAAIASLLGCGGRLPDFASGTT